MFKELEEKFDKAVADFNAAHKAYAAFLRAHGLPGKEFERLGLAMVETNNRRGIALDELLAYRPTRVS